MPVLLPHKLVPWLIRKNCWPDIKDKDVKDFWRHQKLYSAADATCPTSDLHHPYWLWGDDVRYGKRFNQKVMTVMMGHILDCSKNSYRSCFPLWVCGCDSWLLFEILFLYNIYIYIYIYI